MPRRRYLLAPRSRDPRELGAALARISAGPDVDKLPPTIRLRPGSLEGGKEQEPTSRWTLPAGLPEARMERGREYTGTAEHGQGLGGLQEAPRCSRHRPSR